MIRALYRAPAGDVDEPVLYLSVGGLTNLAVAEGTRCLFTRVVGGGIEAIAVELAERKALTLDHARGWLRHVGLVAPLEEIDSDDQDEIVAEARTVLLDGVRRIGGEVRNSLDFHHAQEGMSLRVQRAVLTGAAASVPGFDNALAAELGMPVESGVVVGAPEGVDSHLLTVAAGLAVEEAPHA
jgi:type IV pilus assembly protein PilM